MTSTEQFLERMDEGPVRGLRRPYGVRSEDGLTWFPERQMGYYPVRGNGLIYDRAYFEKYCTYAQTDLGRQITAARLSLVDRFLPHGALLDIGIGSGAFVEARNRGAPTFGFDVNPAGVAWLMEKDLYRDPLEGDVPGMSFWDSLEHLQEPELCLTKTTWAFMTLPIFTGPDHVLASKHFRRDEHIWYFTRDGLIGWMKAQGFQCREHNTMESLLGREDVHTFVFERTA
jgi:Methyltransferase domain